MMNLKQTKEKSVATVTSPELCHLRHSFQKHLVWVLNGRNLSENKTHCGLLCVFRRWPQIRPSETQSWCNSLCLSSIGSLFAEHVQ